MLWWCMVFNASQITYPSGLSGFEHMLSQKNPVVFFFHHTWYIKSIQKPTSYIHLKFVMGMNFHQNPHRFAKNLQRLAQRRSWARCWRRSGGVWRGPAAALRRLRIQKGDTEDYDTIWMLQYSIVIGIWIYIYIHMCVYIYIYMYNIIYIYI